MYKQDKTGHWFEPNLLKKYKMGKNLVLKWNHSFWGNKYYLENLPGWGVWRHYHHAHVWSRQYVKIPESLCQNLLQYLNLYKSYCLKTAFLLVLYYEYTNICTNQAVKLSSGIPHTSPLQKAEKKTEQLNQCTLEDKN